MVAASYTQVVKQHSIVALLFFVHCRSLTTSQDRAVDICSHCHGYIGVVCTRRSGLTGLFNCGCNTFRSSVQPVHVQAYCDQTG